MSTSSRHLRPANWPSEEDVPVGGDKVLLQSLLQSEANRGSVIKSEACCVRP